ncbi:DNA-binding transcriptional MerR regulator [Arthrobacter pigmenti]|uniref:DNA-binding transcriptional MerR regulator n=2 Tax=Arthrobacter pigmenti TaxID=271432 RepID=A0A846RDH0_9MICC|nr:DNA-binding transcriptional MerR regulator [Arthrobacter pigmenti]
MSKTQTAGQPALDAGQTMHIGELADATGLSLRTIRHYDELGLLPDTTRTEGGFRLFTQSDLERLLVIRSMKPLGFTLEEMAELLDVVDRLSADGGNADLRAKLDRYIEEARIKRDKLALKLKQADQFIDELGRK